MNIDGQDVGEWNEGEEKAKFKMQHVEGWGRWGEGSGRGRGGKFAM